MNSVREIIYHEIKPINFYWQSPSGRGTGTPRRKSVIARRRGRLAATREEASGSAGGQHGRLRLSATREEDPAAREASGVAGTARGTPASTPEACDGARGQQGHDDGVREACSDAQGPRQRARPPWSQRTARVRRGRAGIWPSLSRPQIP